MRRWHRLQLRVTDEDRLKVRTDARAGGLSVADYLRRALGLGQTNRQQAKRDPDPVQPQEDDPDF